MDYEVLLNFIVQDVTPGNSDTTSPGKPALGFDGTNYLLVSCYEDDSSAALFGVLINPKDGFQSFLITELNPVYGCLAGTSVAFDGSNYLVVTPKKASDGSTGIIGFRVSTSGTVLDGPDGFVISQRVSGPTAIAFDGTNYLVVSVRFNSGTLHDIIGAFVDTGGQLLEEFQIFTAPGGQVQPAVAFDGINYFVIWSDTRSGSPIGPDADIFGTRISSGGVVLDPQGIPISTAQGSQYSPELVFDGNNYFAVWTDNRRNPDLSPPALDIYGTRVTTSGNLLDGPSDVGGITISNHPRPQSHPTVSFDGTQYFVAWEMSYFYDAPVGIYGAWVSTDGILLDGPPSAGGVLISQPTCTTCRLVFRFIKIFTNQAMLRLKFFQRYTTGDALISAMPFKMRSLSSSLLDTRICRRKVRAIFENAVSIKFNHEPCLGV